MNHPTSPVPQRRREYQEILDGLLQLQEMVPPLKVFGSEAHEFRLNPPLHEAEVVAFETKHRISLPNDYRGFLIQAGNGGAGPSYGLFKLGEMDDGWGHAQWRENSGVVGILAQAFPHTEEWNDLAGRPEFDEVKALGQVNWEYEDAYGERLDEWEEKHYWNTRHINGAIPICHLGCAYREWLVITGPEAGHVWYDGRVDYKGLSPLRIGTTRRVTFLHWYRSWLDGALKQLATND